MVESFADDIKEYYHEDPKRLVKLIIFFVSIVAFLGVLIYWVFTRYDVGRILGLDQ